jgi:hypothetical protein
MNTRRLTKKYKHKSRSRNKNKKTRKSRRRVLKGGVRSVIPSSGRPSRVGVRPSSNAGISKPPKLDFECFYNKLMRTDMAKLPYIIECEKDRYLCDTTLADVEPPKAFPNMNGLKFINYLRGRYKKGTPDEQKKIERIVSLFDQCNMSQGVRYSDLAKIKGQVDIRYYACYEKLYNEVYKKLFPNGNRECFPVSTSAVIQKYN